MARLGRPYWSNLCNVIMHSSDHPHLARRRVEDEKEEVEALAHPVGEVIKLESAILRHCCLVVVILIHLGD